MIITIVFSKNVPFETILSTEKYQLFPSSENYTWKNHLQAKLSFLILLSRLSLIFSSIFSKFMSNTLIYEKGKYNYFYVVYISGT